LLANRYFGLARCDLTSTGQCNWVTIKSFTESQQINLPPSPNRMIVVRAGTTIQLYVNEYLLGTYYDSKYTGYGAVGLVVSTVDSVPAEARFDNFGVCFSSPSAGLEKHTLAPQIIHRFDRFMP